jgi:hypothetical protein
MKKRKDYERERDQNTGRSGVEVVQLIMENPIFPRSILLIAWSLTGHLWYIGEILEL